jgi:uncharacterized protein (DUF342 family)
VGPTAKDDYSNIDFKRLFTIPTAGFGEVVAKNKPAIEGVTGITVLGKLLAAQKGKDILVKNGEGFSSIILFQRKAKN